MSSLENKNIKDSYKDLLQVSNENNGIDDTLRSISDGEGTESSLKLSSTNASFSGNVGIGTDVPGTKLTIQNTSAGALSQYRVGSNYVGQILGDTAGIFGINGRTGIDFSISGVETSALKIDSNGNVGIGTTDPSLAKLQIEGDNDLLRLVSTRSGAGGAEIALIQNSDSPTNEDAHGMINFIGNDTDDAEPLSKTFSSIRGITHDALNGIGRIGLFTRNGVTFQEDMSIVAGKVGIGTTSPSAPLEILQDLDTSSGGSILKVTNTRLNTGTSSSVISLITDEVDGNTADERVQIAGSYDGNNGGKLDILTNNGSSLSSAMTIKADRKVGIGTNDPSGKLEVHTENDNKDVAYGNLADSLLLKNTSDMVGAGPKLIFYNANNSGSPTSTPSALIGLQRVDNASHRGNMVFYTRGTTNPEQRMIIDSNGNVGIGDSAPAQKLSVAGNVHISGDLTVDGEGTEIVTETLKVQDKTIVIADTTSPTEDTSNQAGIIVKGSPDKSFLYNKASQSWNSSNNITINDENVATESWVSNNAFSSLTAAQHAQLKGDQGEPGANGKSAYEIYTEIASPALSEEDWLASLQGPVGTNGADGADGKSAYDIYAEANPVGTLTKAEWLSSLQGSEGDKGDKGDQGDAYFTQTENGISYTDGHIKLQRTDNINSQIHFANNTDEMWSITGDADGDFSLERRIKETGAFSNRIITIEKGSTEALRIDSDGNVGIGTTTPSKKLEIVGAYDSMFNLTREDDANQQMEIHAGAGTVKFKGIDKSNNHDVRFVFETQKGDTLSEKMRIENNGNVGIGRITPVGLLHLQSPEPSLYITDSTTYTDAVISSNNTGDLIFNADLNDESDSATDTSIQFKIDGHHKMNITSDGNVGIGTSDPSAKLHVESDVITGDLVKIALSPTTNGNPAGLHITNTNANFDENAAYLKITDQAGNHKFRVNKNGNVGIGTTSPAFKLDVKGDITSGILSRIENDNTTNSKSTTLLVRNNSSANDSTILGLHNDSDYVLQVKNNGNVAIGHGLYNPTAKISTKVDSPDGEYFLDVKGTTDRQWGFYYDQGSWESSTFRIDEFKADKTAHGRFTIANGGKVGIGDANPSKKLSVAGDAIITGDLTVGGTTISVNTTELEVANKNIIMADSASPSDDLANGGGIVVKASTDKSILFNKTTNKFDVNIGATFSGLVGIGTTTPGSSLHVAGAIGTQPLGNGVHMGIRATGGNRGIIQLNGEGGGYIDFSVSGTDWKGRILYDNPDNYMRFDTNGEQRLRIDSDGNVGIGTTSPTRKLHVLENADDDVATFVNNDSENGYGLNITAGGTATGRYSLRVANKANDVILQANANGNVGIGTNSPQEFLTIKGLTTDYTAIRTSLGGDNENIYWTDWKAASGFKVHRAKGSSGNNIIGIDTPDGVPFTGTGGNIQFNTNSGGTYSERMRIDRDGNVGIGTSNPDAKLHVYQSEDISFTGRTEFARWELKNNLNVQFDGFGDSHSSRPGWFQIGAWNNDTGIAIVSDAVASIENGSSTNGIFIKNGNVGIGTDDPSYKLEVHSSGGSLFVNDNGHLVSKQNLDIQTAGGRLIGESEVGILGDIMIEQANTGKTGGYIRFRTSHDDSTISEKMRITSEGNVGIGTNDPATKLHVAGNVKASSIGLNTDSGFSAVFSKTNHAPAIKFQGINSGIGLNYSIGVDHIDGTNNKLQINRINDADQIVDNLLTIKSDGNIGIGTETPTAPLTVTEVANVAFRMLKSDGSNLLSIGEDGGSSVTLSAERSGGGLIFKTSDSQSTNERMRILSSGNVGIGTTNPKRLLHLKNNNSAIGFETPIDYSGSAFAQIKSSRDGNSGYSSTLEFATTESTTAVGTFGANGTGGSGFVTRMHINSAGNVGIGNTSPGTYKLNVTGNIYANGHVSSNGTILTSDDRIKHNEQPIKNALNTLRKIKPKKYIKTKDLYEANHDFALNAENKPIDEKGEEIEHTIEAGVIAQELKKINELAFVVNDEQTDENGNVVGPHAVNYNSLFTYAISAIQEQQTQIESLESKVKEYENILNIVKEFPPIKAKINRTK